MSLLFEIYWKVRRKNPVLNVRMAHDVTAIQYQNGQYRHDNFFFLNLTQPHYIFNPKYSVIHCTLINLNMFRTLADLNSAKLSFVFLLFTQYKE